MEPKISLIICTRDRASNLKATLEAIGRMTVPADLSAELIVVDNGSTDGTKETANGSTLTNMPVRYLHEPRKGKGNAYNMALAAARGEALLFTDDDVRPHAGWIEQMVQPIISGTADGVLGKVVLPEHLARSWMEPIHKTMLAETSGRDGQEVEFLTGANMAFSRRVTEKVPQFDAELGPGALGFCEETLYSLQLKAAGYKLKFVEGAVIEHHFDVSRLSREAFASRAKGEGRSKAYLDYHWNHQPLNHPHLSRLRSQIKYELQKIGLAHKWAHSEGMPTWEINQLVWISYFDQYLAESNRPRNYEKRGLRKLGSRGASTSMQGIDPAVTNGVAIGALETLSTASAARGTAGTK